MKITFKSQSIKMAYSLYEEFDKGELNDGLDGYRNHLSQSEISVNQILFSYIEALREDHELDLTYVTLANLPIAMDHLYTKLAKRYIPAKAKDQFIKHISAYFMLLSLNMHDLTLSINDGSDFGSRYALDINGRNFYSLLNDHASLKDDHLTLDLKPFFNDYEALTKIDLKDHLPVTIAY
jgi:hypothetical protein